MHLRPLVFRTTPTLKLKTTHHNIHHQFSVEMNATSSHDTSNEKNITTIAKEPVRRKLGSLDCIYKHLGVKKDSVPTKPNDKGRSSSEHKSEIADIDSVKKATTSVSITSTTRSHSEHPYPSLVKDFGVKKEQHLMSIDYRCTLEANHPSNEQPMTNQLSNENFAQHDENLVDTDGGLVQTTPYSEDRSLSEPKSEIADIDSVKKARTSVSNISTTSHSKHPNPSLVKDFGHKKKQHLMSTSYSCTLEAKHPSKRLPRANQLSNESYEQHDDNLVDTDFTYKLKELSLPTRFGKHGAGGWNKKKNTSHPIIEPFDICPFKTEKFGGIEFETEDNIIFRSPTDTEDEWEVIQMDQVSEGPKEIVLKPGMILLKSYISYDEQVLLIKKCRELGLGSGGFYQPGYNDGAKLRLQMMCLGLDWDPQSRKYQSWRRFDRSKPPDIPNEFYMLVDRAMQDSHDLIRKEFRVCKAEEILPTISPDVCIVNFYSETGRLGLHQDRDESKESLTKGLPVVSFSIGDSAEFLYGDQRDPNKAEKVILQSGDVLIFGGESRHVFHGISYIIPNSSPKYLLEETGFRSGRLNLTFRQC